MKGVAIPMKTKHLMQKLTCAVLVPSILLMSACSAKQQPEESTNGMAQPPAIEQQNAKTYAPYTGKTRKSETVYVTMDAKGNASKKIVTDWLHTEQAGVQVTDQSDLEGIQNIKGDTKPVQNGNQITWNPPTSIIKANPTKRSLLTSPSAIIWMARRSSPRRSRAKAAR